MSRTGPLQLDITDLLRQPAVRKAVHRRVELPGLDVAEVTVDDGDAVEIDLHLEATGSSVVADGVIRAAWSGPCRRCLDPVAGVAEAAVHEVFERRPTEGETYLLGEETIDLEPMVRDAALLSLPLAPLCRTDCPGPAPDRQPLVADGSSGPDRPPRDPRWAALDDLRFDS
jgi:uncharacterized protein